MPYTGPYSLGTRCWTEFLATAAAIFVGEAIVANELLPTTKGHAMGFLPVALGFGLAFGFARSMFAYASAAMNPAALMASWVLGDLSAGDFFALAASEFAGAFLAGVLVFLYFWPHFRTVPETVSTPKNNLLRPRHALAPSALRLASYNGHQSPSILDQIKRIKYYLTLGSDRRDSDDLLKVLYGVPVKGDSAALLPSGVDMSGVENGVRRRHSVQVADLHRRLEKLDRVMAESGDATRAEGSKDDLEVIHVDHTPPDVTTTKDHTHHTTNPTALTKALIQADQNTKLAVFATRPAIWLLPHNFFVELVGTAVLVTGALLIEDAIKAVPGDVAGVFAGGLT
ncbi:hypothetical protein HK104_005597, partial [Borealophlyctis nickersoniae]